jgi:hypothetical protein
MASSLSFDSSDVATLTLPSVFLFASSPDAAVTSPCCFRRLRLRRPHDLDEAGIQGSGCHARSDGVRGATLVSARRRARPDSNALRHIPSECTFFCWGRLPVAASPNGTVGVPAVGSHARTPRTPGLAHSPPLGSAATASVGSFSTRLLIFANSSVVFRPIRLRPSGTFQSKRSCSPTPNSIIRLEWSC